jgi:uncharacterized protein (TIGR03435 family)
MIALTNHLWQSTVFAAVAGLLAVVLRKNHAAARYWIWLAASVKFLIPFALLVAVGNQVGWGTIPSPKTPQLAFAVQQFGQLFPASHATPARAPAGGTLLPALLLAGWACGFLAVILSWLIRFRRIRAVVHAAVPFRMAAPMQVRLSPSLPEPGVFGIFRPVLLLPAGIVQQLETKQLQAILAHEWTHVRRRDNLTAALHMIVEALFWFHPLVWWIGARLVEERERACDEAVFSAGHEPLAYAEGILKVCKYCLEAPLLCVSGVSGSDLKNRIQRIMAGRVARDLGWPGRLLLACAGVAAVAVPIGVGIFNAPAARAQSQLAATPAPQFEVASIKAAAPDQRGMFIRTAPGGRVNVANMPLKEMMVLAWHIQPFQISGGPSWIESVRYDISAKPEHAPKEGEVSLMLQALLADRFQLKIHHETKELSLYALVMANKDGKLGPQLKESKEGGCTPFDPSKPPPPPDPGKPRALGCGGIMMGPRGLTVTSAPIDQMIPVLSRILERTVVDQTGLKGKFDLTLQWTPDPSQGLQPPPGSLPPGAPQPPPVDPNGPSIFTALQEQLGLKLESQKGPVDMIVIDSVEKPSEN